MHFFYFSERFILVFIQFLFLHISHTVLENVDKYTRVICKL